MKKIWIYIALSLPLTLLAPAQLLATDGYFSHGYGTQYKGMAGVGTALARSSLIAAINPAGLPFLGTRYDLGLGLFAPTRQYTVTGMPSGFPGTFPLSPGTVESDKPIFIIPTFGANWMLNDQSSLGLTLYGNGGMNTQYPTKVFDNPMAPVTEPTGVNLSQMFASISYARIFAENHSFGVSGIVAYQWFEAQGLQAFSGFSQDPTALTNNGSDNSLGYGFRVGYMGKFNSLSVGASFQSRIWMSEFESYAGLFAENGDFDIPANWSVGLAYQLSPKLLLAFDVKQILYSQVQSIANPMDLNALSPVLPDGSPNPNHIPLGAVNGSGFGWKDMMVYKIGGEYAASENWTLRGGYSFGQQPIPPSEVMFNILAPGVIQNQASLGFSRFLGKNELSFAFTHAFSNTVEGANPMEAPSQQSIELKMHQFDIELGFSF